MPRFESCLQVEGRCEAGASVCFAFLRNHSGRLPGAQRLKTTVSHVLSRFPVAYSWRASHVPVTHVYVCVCVCVCVSYLCLFVTSWTVAHQAPLSMEFSRQEYWGWLPFPSPGHLPYPGIKPRSSELQADSLLSEPPGKPTHYTFVVKCLKLFIF